MASSAFGQAPKTDIQGSIPARIPQLPVYLALSRLHSSEGRGVDGLRIWIGRYGEEVADPEMIVLKMKGRKEGMS